MINMIEELVSLIVPVYNGGKYLYRFYEFFERQTYSNIELILIDDGSTDESNKICDNIADKDSRVKVFHKENEGPSSARNYGIAMAQGEYIIFSDIDDYIYPDYIRYLYNIIKQNNSDLAMCSYIKMCEKANFESYIKEESKDKVIEMDRESAIYNLCRRNMITGYSYLKLVKASIAKETKFPENIFYGEDFIYSYELIKKCNKIVYGNRILYVYIQYPNSETHIIRDNTKKYQNAWKAHLGIIEDIKFNHYKSFNAIIEKCFLLAINNITRVYDKNRDKIFWDELFTFIRNYSSTIIKDKDSKIITKVLALCSKISIEITCKLCKLFFKIQLKLGSSFKRTI